MKRLASKPVLLAASAPGAYTHSDGGGAYNDGTNAETGDIRKEHQGADFACGDIVSYMALVRMQDTTTVTTQTIEMSFGFLAESTGQNLIKHGEPIANHEQTRGVFHCPGKAR